MRISDWSSDVCSSDLTARVAAVLAAKRCAELLPLCHSLPLAFVGVEFALRDDTHAVEVRTTCRTQYKTGVEMEAMTAASVAALTIYDKIGRASCRERVCQ